MSEATDRHPDELTMAAYLDGGLRGAERDRYEAHLASCDECRSAGILLAGRAEEPGVAASGQRWRIPVFLRVAAVLLIVIGAGWWMRSAIVEHPPAPGEAGRESVYREAAPVKLEAIEPSRGETVGREELQFRWTAIPGVDSYEIVVIGPSGEALGRLAVGGEETVSAWPADHELPPGQTLLWQVRGLRLGRAIAESRPSSFEIR